MIFECQKQSDVKMKLAGVNAVVPLRNITMKSKKKLQRWKKSSPAIASQIVKDTKLFINPTVIGGLWATTDLSRTKLS